MIQNLPLEILLQVIRILPTAQSVARLAQVSHYFHDIILEIGWKAFSQSRFPSICPAASASWADTSRSLTSISRCWDRKTFLARMIHPPAKRCFRSGQDPRYPFRYRLPRGWQTVGYQSAVDSYRERSGGDRTSSKEVVAWGAGSILLMRLALEGTVDAPASRSPRSKRPDGSNVQWFEYSNEGDIEGRDDITGVKILRPHQRARPECPGTSEEVIIGRRNGKLYLVRITANDYFLTRNTIAATFDTGSRRVSCIAVSQSSEPLLAACLSDRYLAVYRVRSSATAAESRVEEAVGFLDLSSTTWSVQFLAPHRLVVAGPFPQPLRVIHVGPEGLCFEDVISNDMSTSLLAESIGSIAKSLARLDPDYANGEGPGDMFLSGWNDGSCRLHDLRSPSACVADFNDPVTQGGSVYCMATMGRERFVAGGSMNGIVKSFDIRLPGARAYTFLDAHPCKNDNTYTLNSKSRSPLKRECCSMHKRIALEESNWTVMTGSPAWPNDTRRSTPVYSLSVPAPDSPRFFAGLENCVVQFDFVSPMDEAKWSDVLAPSKARNRGVFAANLKHRWNPARDLLNLSSYHHVGRGDIMLATQGALDRYLTEPARLEWDERWIPSARNKARPDWIR